MKDIIVVGTSKAGYLHIESYNKINNKANIYYVDISEGVKNKNIKKQRVYKSIKEAMLENNIRNNNVIIDICTPKEEFYNIIHQCIELDINDIIVEKPFIASKKFFEKNKKLNIIMTQNYLYSEITKDIITFINERNLKIKTILTDFSKNRIADSLNKRGFMKEITQNFEIEIPHQIYLANYILGYNGKINIMYKEQKDFLVGNVTLKKHGYGKVIMMQDDVIVVHESDLMSENNRKEINIICDNNICINAKYLLYDENLNMKQNGKLTVRNNNSIIMEKNYITDDNMYNCLSEYYNYFNNNTRKSEYIDRIIIFSKILKKILN